MKQEFKVPYKPDSVNSHWKKTKMGGMYLSKEGREFRKNVQRYLSISRFRKVTGKLKVYLELHFKDNRRRDIDNYCKGIFDSLNNFLWDDDEQIYELHTVKKLGTGKDFFVIVVETLEE